MKLVFTKHSEERMITRKILLDEVIDVVKCPDKIIKKHDRHYFQKQFLRGKIEVVVEKTTNNLKIRTIC